MVCCVMVCCVMALSWVQLFAGHDARLLLGQCAGFAPKNAFALAVQASVGQCIDSA
jgi:hypothetical protein